MSRVLILTQCFPPQIGGIENFMHGMASALAGRGAEVTVFADGHKAEGAHPFTVKRFAGLKAARRRRKALAAMRFLVRHPDALVLADSWKSLEHLPAFACKRAVCFLHGMEFPHDPSARKTRRMKRSLKKARLLCANSHFTASLAAPYIGNVHVVQPCVDESLPADEGALAAMRARVPGSPLLATLCRLEPRKGIDQVIRALPELARSHPSIAYAVAGGGADMERLRALAEETGVGARVHFLGRVSEEEKAALLTLADIFAMPVRREGDSVEGFGAAYIEAGGHGTPSIAGKSGGAAEAVEDGVTGIVCEDTSPECFAAAANRLLADPALLKTYGENARTKARNLSWQGGLGRYVALFDGV